MIYYHDRSKNIRIPTMHKGYLCLVLHAHLPFVRHPEEENFLEENWLYEAITETYIPFIQVFEKLIEDHVDFRITMSLTPTLVSMLQDELLQNRYIRHIDKLIELCYHDTVFIFLQLSKQILIFAYIASQK